MARDALVTLAARDPLNRLKMSTTPLLAQSTSRLVVRAAGVLLAAACTAARTTLMTPSRTLLLATILPPESVQQVHLQDADTGDVEQPRGAVHADR